MNNEVQKNYQTKLRDYDNNLLLKIEYMTDKVIWRLFFPYALIFLLFGGTFMLILERVLVDGCSTKDCFGLSFFGLIIIVALISSVEILLMKDIKIYSDRIEKEWLFFGTKHLSFSNAKLRGIKTWFISNKAFLYLKKPRWYMLKCCSYDENLISENDKEEAMNILANISHRDVNEFKKIQVAMNPLIKNKG
jgi:hypothetical protein